MSFRRVLVIQVRDSAADRECEQMAFASAAGRFCHSLRYVDAFHEVPNMEREEGVQGVIIAGSALSVFEPGVPYSEALTRVVETCVSHNWPLLGICFGAQFIAQALGGTVVRDKVNEELGTHEIRLRPDAEHDALLRDLPDRFLAQQAHQDCISCLPEGGILLASSEYCHVQAFRMHGAPVYGLQFHPERSMEDMARRYEPMKQPLRPSPEAYGLVHTFIKRVVFGIV